MSKALLQIPFMLIGWDLSDEDLGQYLGLMGQHDFVLEPKVDDVRAQMHFGNGHVRLQTRGYNEVTANYPQFKRCYKASLEGTVLDGGLVAGLAASNTRRLWKSDFPLMISINGSLPERAIEVQEERGYARYVIFDVVYYKGRTCVKLPLEQRLDLVDTLAEQLDLDCLSHHRVRFHDVWSRITKDDGEGVVLKKKGSPYVFGRSEFWARIKRFEDVECFLSGNTEPGLGKYDGLLGSVEVVDVDGKSLAFVSGITDAERRELSDGSGLKKKFVGKKVLVRHNPWKNEGLRHPRILRIEGLEKY